MELIKHFTSVKDTRVEGRCLHLLGEILVLVLIGTIADCDDYTEVSDYCKANLSFLRSEVGLSLLNGVPSEDTFWRVNRYLKPSELEKGMCSCAKELFNNLKSKHLCIDGKAHRGTIPVGKKQALVQTVSVWVGELSLSFGQVSVAKKSNEITAIPLLLDSIKAPCSVITIDAIGCQKEILTKIVEDNKCDYVIALKKNQGNLYEQVSDWMEKQSLVVVPATSVEKGHGRIETRKVYSCPNAPDFLDATQDWTSINTLVMVERIRQINDKETTAKSFYISSLVQPTSQEIGIYIRNHWGIENGLHWQLDVTFREDNSQVKKDFGAQNLNIYRKFALFLLSKNSEKISFKRKRKKAGQNNEFLMSILNSA
jgi:predicted transposase YbfD/YdcC